MLRSVRYGVYRLLRHEALQRLQIVRVAAIIVQQCCASSLVRRLPREVRNLPTYRV